MAPWDFGSERSRRRFLQQLGLGSGLVGLGALGGIALPRATYAACPSAGTGAGKLWRRDCRAIQPRRPASTLSSAEVQKLRDAYAAMRALDTSDPSDPRGFMQQAQIHCWYCVDIPAGAVHWNWRFFGFHRAYLYFHERILGSLIGDMAFRLPYWDWESPSHRAMPAPHTAPADPSNPLWNSTRGLGATEELPEEDVGTLVMENALLPDSFAEFGGTSSSNGVPEGAPHGSVHVDVAGDMSTFENAAKDPIFYAHHANVDKIWSDWNKASSTHVNPSDPVFLNLSWNFFDENKVWRSIKAAQLLNHENQLRYSYGPSSFVEKFLCLLDWIIIRTTWRERRVIVLPPDVRRRLMAVIEGGGRVRIHVRGLEVPQDRSAVYRLYLDARSAEADRGPEGPGYLGTVPVVLNSGEGGHRRQKQTRDVVLLLTRQTVEALAKAEAQASLALVARGSKEGARVLPVRARDVYFSYAEVER